MLEWILEGEFINTMQNAVNRGVHIKIETGFGDGKRKMRTIKWAEDLKGILKDNILLSERNTHEKIVLCDDKFSLKGCIIFDTPFKL